MEIIKTEHFFTGLPPIHDKSKDKRKLMISETMEFKMDQVLHDVANQKAKEVSKMAA